MLDKIISGEKKYEMRKCLPNNLKLGEDGFFIVEKGTDKVKCWCRVDSTISMTMNEFASQWCCDDLCVTPEFILNYAPIGTKVYILEIGKVNLLQDLCRNSLFVYKNPQQFAYCRLSYGESY